MTRKILLALMVPGVMLVSIFATSFGAYAQQAVDVVGGSVGDGGDVIIVPAGVSGVPGVAHEGTVGVEASPPVDVPIDADMVDQGGIIMPDVACDFQGWVGMTKDAASAEARKTGRPFRILGPGSMATMDFSPVRINVEYDAHDIVTRVFCG